MKQSRSLRAVLGAAALAGVLMFAAGPASATPDRVTAPTEPSTADCKPGQSCGGCKAGGWSGSDAEHKCLSDLANSCAANGGRPWLVGMQGTDEWGVQCDRQDF